MLDAAFDRNPPATAAALETQDRDSATAAGAHDTASNSTPRRNASLTPTRQSQQQQQQQQQQQSKTPSRRTTMSSSSSNSHHASTRDDMASGCSSLYDTFGGMGGELGKSPFSLPLGDKSAATYLAQCYERMMKHTASIHSSSAPHPTGMFNAATAPATLAASVGSILLGGEIDEPTTYVFIFTNPRSGNQQGRSLMNMALSNFRLRDRPEVQVQIYDVTNEESQKEGLHYLHQLQLRQGDRLLKTAFPELFGSHSAQVVRPSPSMCHGNHSTGACSRASDSKASSPKEGKAASTGGGVVDVDVDVCAWDEWISEAAAELESGLDQFSEEEITERLRRAQESAINLHVWSAGGDGTVSATIQAMFDNGIDVNRVYFSCIPFGTGNDFSDALGWGRSVPGDAVGESMKLLNKIITERLNGYTCKLDIYEMTFTTYDDGHIKHVEKDMFKQPGMKRHTCLMIDYFSLGVQGFVGSSFEMHRPGKRSLNILMYTAAAAKWVFMKKFPPINEALESISTVPDAMLKDPKLTDADRAKWLEGASEADRKQVLLFRVAGPRKRSHGRKMKWAKEPKARHKATARDFGEGVDENLPVMRMKPIEIDVQNVARFWGRNIDVWNSARDEDTREMLSNTTGVTDSKTWTPQYAGDGKVELFGVRDIGDYALNQMPGRKDYRIGRLAQMVSPVALHFREPQNYPPRTNNPLTNHKSIEQGLLYGMCDGEFIEMYHPRDIIISRKVTLKAVGRSPESSRIVLDTIKNDGLDAVQMDATAAADKTQSGRPADMSNYVSSPFQRIFGFTRRSTATSSKDAPQPLSQTNSGSSNGPRSPVLAAVGGSNGSGKSPSRSSSLRRSTLNTLRSSMLFMSRRTNSVSSTEEAGSPLTAAMPSRSNSTAVRQESPLKLRQSLSDLPGTSSAASRTADDSAAHSATKETFVLRRHVAHRAQSKSLDITHERRQAAARAHPASAGNRVLTADPASAHRFISHSPDQQSLVSDAYTTSESESESELGPESEHTGSFTAAGNADQSQMSKHNDSRDSADTTSEGVHLVADHCLMTIGKDIVEKAENLKMADEPETAAASPSLGHPDAAAAAVAAAAAGSPPMQVA